MSDDKLLLPGKGAAPAVTNLALMSASIPDLLAELERKGVNIPQTTFDLVQQMHELRDKRWNANNGGMTVRKEAGKNYEVVDADGVVIATFLMEYDAQQFANPQFTSFERAAEVAGEVGELVNAVKKLRRHEIKMPGNYKPGEGDVDKLYERAAYEIGDVFVTCFNLTNKLQISAWNCIQMAFNTKSDEMGFPEKL